MEELYNVLILVLDDFVFFFFLLSYPTQGLSCFRYWFPKSDTMILVTRTKLVFIHSGFLMIFCKIVLQMSVVESIYSRDKYIKVRVPLTWLALGHILDLRPLPCAELHEDGRAAQVLWL